MSPQKLSLSEVSKNMGIELPKSGDGSQGSQPQPASAADLQEDSQPHQKNPKIQILLIGLGLFCTLGMGTMLLLWGLGSVTTPQVAKKPDSLTNGEQAVKSTPEQQKEVADLKTKLVMEQQKAEAARVTAEQAKAASPAPAPTPASVPTVTPVATNTATKPISQMQPSTQDRALLAALQKEKQETTAQLASIRQSRQQETDRLNSLRQSRQQQEAQIAAQRQVLQKENSQLLASKAATANEQRKRDLLRTQQNRNVAPQPIGVVRQTAIATAKPQPTRVAAVPKTSSPTVAPQPRLDWEQASALSSYGGTPEDATPKTTPTNQPIALTGGSAMSPILRLPVGQVVNGKLVTPFYTLISENGIAQNAKASATVTIDRAIEVGSGWHLPAGSAIEFELQIADNGMIQAVSKKVTYGNTEIDIPVGAFSITGNDNQPLFAQIKEVNGSQLASADFRSALFGGAAEVGNVLVNSGNSSTVSIGAGTTIATQNNGGGNIIGGIFKGAFSPLAQTQVNRAQTLANKVDKMSKVGYLLPGTSMRVYVAKAATFQIPTDSTSAQPLTPTQATIPTVAPKVAMTVIDPPDPTVTQSVTNSSGSKAIAPNPYYTPPADRVQLSPQPAVVPSQPTSDRQAVTNPYTSPTPTPPSNRTSESPQPPVSTPQPVTSPYSNSTPTPPADRTAESPQPPVSNPQPDPSSYSPTPTQPPGNPTQPPIVGEASGYENRQAVVSPYYSPTPTQPLNLPTSQGNLIVQPPTTVPSNNPQLVR
jgi:hypothetical protein